MADKSLLTIFFLLLVSEVLSILKFESSFFLGVNHKIVGHFMVEVVHIQTWDIIFWGFTIDLIKWAFLAGNRFLVVFNFSIFGNDGVFGIAVVFDFAWGLCELGGDLFIDDGVNVIGLFDGLDSPNFFLLVKIDRVFHQLIQIFN